MKRYLEDTLLGLLSLVKIKEEKMNGRGISLVVLGACGEQRSVLKGKDEVNKGLGLGFSLRKVV